MTIKWMRCGTYEVESLVFLPKTDRAAFVDCTDIDLTSYWVKFELVQYANDAEPQIDGIDFLYFSPGIERYVSVSVDPSLEAEATVWIRDERNWSRAVKWFEEYTETSDLREVA